MDIVTLAVANAYTDKRINDIPSAEGKVDKAQGIEHAGEFLVVGDDGNVTTIDIPAYEGEVD